MENEINSGIIMQRKGTEIFTKRKRKKRNAPKRMCVEPRSYFELKRIFETDIFGEKKERKKERKLGKNGGKERGNFVDVNEDEVELMERKKEKKKKVSKKSNNKKKMIV